MRSSEEGRPGRSGGKRRLFRLGWWLAAVCVYFGSLAAGLNLTRPYVYAGLLFLLAAMVADRTLISGERARGEFYFDWKLFGDKERRDRQRFASAALFYALPLLAMPLLHYFLLR